MLTISLRSPCGTNMTPRAYNSGHQIASHTWSHKDLTGQGASGIQTEVQRLETALKKILGIKPKWLRPPYGGQNSNVLNTLKGYNYKVVTWNLDSQDWNGAYYKDPLTASTLLTYDYPP